MTKPSRTTLTIVTALLDIGRGADAENLPSEQKRSFSEYWAHFSQLLAMDSPLVIYTSPDLEHEVWQHRNSHNTQIRRLTPASLERDFPGFAAVQTLRGDAVWRGQAAWLAGSPQAVLPHYNPLVMSKLAMLDSVAQNNPFDSTHIIWLDAGIARTCGGMLGNRAWLRRLPAYLDPFLLLSFPYPGGSEIHGFARPAMARWSGTEHVGWVARGGLFGGSPSAIHRVSREYHHYLDATLAAGDMGTEESVLTLVAHRHPDLFHRVTLAENGMIAPFMEALAQEDTGTAGSTTPGTGQQAPPAPLPTARRPPLSVYILTFNCPEQLRLLLDSWYDDWQEMPALRLFIVDNSSRADCIAQNARLSRYIGAAHLPQGNLGVCGGRQFVADHFHESGAATMLYLEDDMLRWHGEGVCRSGFPRCTERLLQRAMAILAAEQLDFLKLSFTEFYGANDRQWAWHNVTEEKRQTFWPACPRRSEGLALDDIPPVRFSRVGSRDGLAFATGEVFYSNWPQLVSRRGNQRMFLDTRWQHPHEQTWMAHLFERAHRGELHGGVLLASPIEHRRDHHYPAEERIES